MDHKTFLASLTPEQRTDLTGLSDAKGLKHLAGHFAAIVVCSVWIAQGWLFWPCVLLVQGILLVFLFTLLHETSHKTPFKSAWLNVVVGHLCGFLLFLPSTWFRYFHFAHHRYTQIPEKDPELSEPKPETWHDYVVHVSGLPVWVGHGKVLFRNVSGAASDAFVPDPRRVEVFSESRIYLTGYMILLFWSIWAGTAFLIYVWILPVLLGQPFLRLYLLAEHGRCAFVANMFENTRTTFTNRLVRALAWNMPFHAEHHSYPSVPFHKLPKLHALTAEHLQVTADGYAVFTKDYVRQVVR